MLCTLVFFKPVYGQKLDSLQAELEAYESPCSKPCEEDSSKVLLLLRLGEQYESVSLDSAERLYHQAQKLAQEIDDQGLLSKAWSYLGIVKWLQGVYDESLKYHYKALAIREEMKNPVLVAYTYNNIGLVHFYTGNFSDAESSYRQALAIYQDLSDTEGESAAYTNLGLVKRYAQQGDSAIYYYEKSLALDMANGDEAGVATCYNNLGNAAKDHGEYQKALDYFTNALEVFNKQKDFRSVATIYGNIASTYLLQNKNEEALTKAREGAKMAREAGALAVLKDNYEHISKALSNLGRDQEALEYYKEYIHYKDSLVNVERWTQIDEIKTKYNAEKQAAEAELRLSEAKRNRNFFIWLSSLAMLAFISALVYVKNKRERNRELKYKNAQIIRQQLHLSESLGDVNKLNSELERSNKAKDKFFSILAHDLKGPVVSIKQAITMVHNHFDSFTSEEIKQYLDKLKNSSERANNLLVNLLDWSLSQKGLISFSPEENDIVDMLEQNIQLKKGIAEQKGIALVWEKPEPLLISCDFGMVNTVIRNLISNALKFTPSNGSIHIDLEHDEEKVKVKVKDSGVGMSKQKVESLFLIDQAQSEKGTEGESGTGLGLILCREFIEMHDGKIGVESEIDQGSEFWFELPFCEES